MSFSSSKDRSLSRLRRHLKLIDDGVEPVMQRYRDHVQCRAGCSQCCHQSFRISEIEAAYLKEGLRQVDVTTRQDILERARAYRPGEQQPCPILSEQGHCRLYEHRPRICRKYGIPLWHPNRPYEVRTCELNFRGVGDIDTELIVDPQAKWAEDWIDLRAELDLGRQQMKTIAEFVLDD